MIKHTARLEWSEALETGLPEIEDHRSQHALLVMRVQTLWGMIESGEKVTPQGISLFLSDWIVDHMLEKDKKIGEFARGRS